MSISLLKKSLQLCAEPEPRSEIHSKRSVSEGRRSKSFKKAVPVDEKRSAVLLVKKIREKNKRKKEENSVESNVQKLLNLSSHNSLNNKKLQSKLIEKLNKPTKKKKTSNGKNEKEVIKSVFTDEDFENFRKEYCGDN